MSADTSADMSADVPAREKLKLMLTQSSCTGTGTELGKNEDDLEKEYNPKSKEDVKIKDSPKNEDNVKKEGSLEMKTHTAPPLRPSVVLVFGELVQWDQCTQDNSEARKISSKNEFYIF